MKRNNKNITVNNKVKELRESQGLYQQTLADRLGISRQNLSYIENGSSNFTLETAFLIANFFGKEIGEVFYQDQLTKD